jgi:DNA-binding NtrC family response regulator
MHASARTRILIADDSDVCRTVLAILLKNSGFEVVSVINGREALEKIAAQPFDLAVLDHDMPELNGLDTLREIRRLAPEQPVVIVSGRLSADLRQAYGSLHIKGLWAKPVDPRKLRNELMAIIEQQHLSRGSDNSHAGAPFPSLGAADAALEKPFFAGSSAPLRKLIADFGRIRDFRSAATIVGRPGAAFLETAVALGEEKDALLAACTPGTLDADWLARFALLAGRQDRAALVIVLHAHLLSPAQQDLVEEYLAGNNANAPRADRSLAVLCTEVELCPLADAGAFSEMLLLRAGAARLPLPPLPQRKPDLPMIARAVLRRIGAASVNLADSARARLDAPDWPGDYLQLHRTVEIAHRLHPRLTEIPATALEEAMSREPGWTTSLYHDVLLGTLQPGE